MKFKPYRDGLEGGEHCIINFGHLKVIDDFMSNEKQINTLNNITVNKDNLLTVLRENREAHNEVFNASMQAYYEAVRAELEEKKVRSKELTKLISQRLKDSVTSDNPFKGLNNLAQSIAAVQSRKPSSHEDDYISAIRKVELSVHNEFTLTNQEFERYVLNNWDWAEEFLNTATQYSNHTGLYSGALTTGIQKFARRA